MTPSMTRYPATGLILFAIIMTAGPAGMTSTAHAQLSGQVEGVPRQLETASNLSNAFKFVARSLRPSVVSISSVRRVAASRQLDEPRPLPDELRRFFGDEFAERFDFGVNPRELRGRGTGVIVNPAGYILTNSHVVDGADEVEVTLADDRKFSADLVGIDKPTDLAVLKIEATDLSAGILGDSSILEVGDWVLAIGSPFGLDQTVTAGIVSATGRDNVGIADYEDFIQTDAAINPGNSGGPLVNLKGEVVGIATAIASRSGGNMGVGFAIPSNMAKLVMENLISSGRVQRGYIGALVQDLDRDLAESFGYSGTRGVLLGDVLPGAPAANAGLRAGDIVLEFDGVRMDDANELRHTVAAARVGEIVELRVFREGATAEFAVTIGELESTEQPVTPVVQPSVYDDLGIRVQPVPPGGVREFGVDAGALGALVTDVRRGSAAAAAGLRTGDLIVAVGTDVVDSVTDFRAAVGRVEGERGIRLQVVRDGVRRFVFVRPR